MINNTNISGDNKFSNAINEIKRETIISTNSRTTGMMLRRTTRGTYYVPKPIIQQSSGVAAADEEPAVLRWL
jgi:hypothetical protein